MISLSHALPIENILFLISFCFSKLSKHVGFDTLFYIIDFYCHVLYCYIAKSYSKYYFNSLGGV